MCGLVGVIAKTRNGFNNTHQDMFSTLLFIDTLRGSDSTGAFTVTNSGDVEVAKEASDAFSYMKSKEYNKLQQTAWRTGAAMIGHNRKATRGTINDENAHPFNVDDNIILVHNGTMYGDHKKHADVEVDSHAIAHLIHEHNNDLEKALGSFYGAYALMWYDIRQSKLSMIRNDDRPLWWVESDSAWYWSSEKEMLEFAMARHKVKTIDGPAQLPAHKLVEYTLGPNGWDVDMREISIKRTAVQGGWPQSGHSSFQGATNYDDFEDGRYFHGHSMRRIDGWRMPQHMEHRHQPPAPAPTQSQVMGAGEPMERAGLEGDERLICIKNKKIVTHAEYIQSVNTTYPYGDSTYVQPFDYHYVNGEDDTAGFYIYSSPLDDSSVVFRKFLSGRNVTENQVIQIASGNSVYEVSAGTRSWSALDPTLKGKNVEGNTEGYCILRTSHWALIANGIDAFTGAKH